MVANMKKQASSKPRLTEPLKINSFINGKGFPVVFLPNFDYLEAECQQPFLRRLTQLNRLGKGRRHYSSFRTATNGNERSHLIFLTRPPGKRLERTSLKLNRLYIRSLHNLDRLNRSLLDSDRPLSSA
jgi:hypothetical protein